MIKHFCDICRAACSEYGTDVVIRRFENSSGPHEVRRELCPQCAKFIDGYITGLDLPARHPEKLETDPRTDAAPLIAVRQEWFARYFGF